MMCLGYRCRWGVVRRHGDCVRVISLSIVMHGSGGMDGGRGWETVAAVTEHVGGQSRQGDAQGGEERQVRVVGTEHAEPSSLALGVLDLPLPLHPAVLEPCLYLRRTEAHLLVTLLYRCLSVILLYHRSFIAFHVYLILSP